MIQKLIFSYGDLDITYKVYKPQEIKFLPFRNDQFSMFLIENVLGLKDVDWIIDGNEKGCWIARTEVSEITEKKYKTLGWTKDDLERWIPIREYYAENITKKKFIHFPVMTLKNFSDFSDDDLSVFLIRNAESCRKNLGGYVEDHMISPYPYYIESHLCVFRYLQETLKLIGKRDPNF